MGSIVQGLPHVICYLDDILVTGVTEKEHLENLVEVLRQLKESGVTLFRWRSAPFLMKSTSVQTLRTVHARYR